MAWIDLNTDPQILENPFLSLVPQDIPSSISSWILGKDKNTCTCHLSYLVLYLGLNGVEIHNNMLNEGLIFYDSKNVLSRSKNNLTRILWVWQK